MRTLVALLVLSTALGAAAQSDSEYGRASSGAIDAITKGPSQFSGSFSLSRASAGSGYGGTLGGEVLKDHLWVFAAASVLPQIHFSKSDVDAKATAQPVDWNSVTASFSQSGPQTLQPFEASLPSSFLSLRSTTLLSERMMLNISYSRSTTTRNVFDLTGAGWYPAKP